MMITKSGKAKRKPTWTDLKGRLTGLDRSSLLGLIHDLYAASKDNQAFLHARFGVGDDALKPYKATISRWVYPDFHQAVSVAKAKKAISNYRKAIGHPEGVAVLMVFYCEECTAFLGYCSMDDEGYFDALVRMFERVLKAIRTLDHKLQKSFIERLERVRRPGHNYSYGVGDDMDDLMTEYGFGGE